MSDPRYRGRVAPVLRGFALLCAILLVGGCASTATPSPPNYPGWPPGTSYELIPIPASSELVVGQNRFLLNLIDQQNQPLPSPDRSVQLRFYDLAVDPAQPASTAAGTYLPIAAGRPGLYRAQVSFDRAGDWGVEAVVTEPSGHQRTGRTIFSVRQDGSTPPIGAPAPSEDTPTATSPDAIAAISTDTAPDPDFYRQSVAGALAAHQPFLLIFATPAFCVSQTCGPALDVVKSVAPDFKDKVTFIHVEPYEMNMVDGHLQTVLSEQNFPIPIQAVEDYGLPTEPYIFVVNSLGKVSAKFEGVAGADELRAALSAVSQ
jgi:hypothetical protein